MKHQLHDVCNKTLLQSCCDCVYSFSDQNDFLSQSYVISQLTCLDFPCNMWTSKSKHITSTITFERGSCSNPNPSRIGGACESMASSTTKKVNIHIGQGSCTSDRGTCTSMARDATNLKELSIGRDSCSNLGSCAAMAGLATNLEELSISSGSCTKVESCTYAARKATSLKQLIIDDNQCQSSGDCEYCGRDSTFSETLQLTTDCCNEVTGEYNGYKFDTACQYSEPSSIPSDQPSNEGTPVLNSYMIWGWSSPLWSTS